MIKRWLSAVAMSVLVGGCASVTGSAPSAGIAAGGAMAAVVMEEFRVPSDPGIEVYVRNKRPAGVASFTADKTLIYVHGATYPSETAFDLKLDGLSWMDYIAQRGYDVYLLDVRGYGQSTRPPQTDQPGEQAALIPAGWFDAWANATFASDPVGARQNPPVLRAPNGVVADGNKYWGNGVIPWKAENITVPVLLIKAEWDADTPAYMAQNLFPKLTGAPYKRYVELGEGTHTIIMEKNRMNLFREVQLFLDESHAAAK